MNIERFTYTIDTKIWDSLKFGLTFQTVNLCSAIKFYENV